MTLLYPKESYIIRGVAFDIYNDVLVDRVIFKRKLKITLRETMLNRNAKPREKYGRTIIQKRVLHYSGGGL